MIAGSIFTFGHVGESAGMMMKRGTIAMFGLDRPDDPPLLPTFFRSGQFRPHFLTIYLKQLVEWGFPIPTAMFAGPLARYNGDLAERGQGEILVWPATG
jgi:formylmethanofuran dehydrogenase subunit C